MNNGVNETNQTNPSVNEEPALMPMAGVKIAPAADGPVNASSSATASQAVSTVKQAEQPAPPAQVSTTPVATAAVQASTQTPAAPTPQPIEDKPVITQQIPAEEPKVEIAEKKTKKKINIIPILIIIIIALIFYIVYSSQTHKAQLENLTYNCTPITASKDEVKLDLNSTLVKDLYSKVHTTIREDLAQPQFNDNMKLYLAYRQVLENDKYDSNCNLFNDIKMEPYKCEVSTNFVPKAFKEEQLVEEIKQLFGEKTTIPLANIQLGSSCIGGYQYIPARGEFVQGFCNENKATSYKVTKTLKEATSTRNTIILKEEVKYHENEKMTLPDFLKSGTYYYTFRLDMNYNYVLVSKTYETKY